jgi:hypothetical protein
MESAKFLGGRALRYLANCLKSSYREFQSLSSQQR